MATTNLIADFLIIGTCSLVWLIPVALLVGLNMATVNSLGLAPSFALLGGIYVVGICINRFADDITGRRNNNIRDEVFANDPDSPSYHTRLNTIVAESDSAADYLSYRRSIVRITRSCALNFLLGVLAWLTMLIVEWRSHPRPRVGGTIAAVAVCVGVTILLARAWPVVLKGYFSSIRDMYSYLAQRPS